MKRKLSDSVFDLTPNPRFFYANRVYQEAFLALRYGIKLRKGVIILTGGSGTGKTSLIAVVKDRRESNARLAIVPSPDQGSSGLVRLILRAFGLTETASDREAQIAEIRRYLVEQFKENKIVALIVERAQELDLDGLQELESLSKLNSDGQRLLQLVLVGRPELETKLAHPTLEAFKQSVALWCRVEPLQRDEVGAYIDYRLACAGHPQAGLFQSDAVERIAAYSKGVPGLINTICQKALSSVYAASPRYVTAETIDQVWGSLRRTGETEFEVAALLSEIRHYSRLAGKDMEDADRNTRMDAGPQQEGQFAQEESMSRVEHSGRRKPRQPLAWMAKLRSAAQQNVLSRLAALTHSASRLGVWRETVKQITPPELGISGDRGPGRSNLRWFGWSAILGVVVLAGSVALLSRGQSAAPESYGMQSMREAAEIRQAAGAPEQRETAAPADVPPFVVLAVPPLADVSQEPEEPQQGAMRQHATVAQYRDGQPKNQEQSSIQASSPEKATPAAKNNQFAPIIYVHTSEERDRSVLDEIGQVLRVNGYTVRDTRFSTHRTGGDVRFFFPPDRREAERVKSVVQSELGKRGYSLALQLLERDGNRFEHAAPGKIEVWLPPLIRAQRPS
jgi:general secretion pathway protein A